MLLYKIDNSRSKACFFQCFASHIHKLQNNMSMANVIEESTESGAVNGATDDNRLPVKEEKNEDNDDVNTNIEISPTVDKPDVSVTSDIEMKNENKISDKIEQQIKKEPDIEHETETPADTIPDVKTPTKRTPTKVTPTKIETSPVQGCNITPQPSIPPTQNSSSITTPTKSMLTRTNTGAIKHHYEHKKDNIQNNHENQNGGEPPPKKRRKKKLPVRDELLKCEVCGVFGMTSEFCASGRFCSQRCVGAHASKCRADSLALAAANAAAIAATAGNDESGDGINDSKKKKKKKKKKKPVGKKKYAIMNDSTDQYGMGDDVDYEYDSTSNIKASSKQTRSDFNSNKVVDDDSMVFYNAEKRPKGATKHCCWDKCTSDSRYPEKLPIGTFFIRFPKPGKQKPNMSQLELRDMTEKTFEAKQWLDACGRKDFTLDNITKDTYICSLHFIGPHGPCYEHPYPVIDNRSLDQLTGLMKVQYSNKFDWNLYMRVTKSTKVPAETFLKERFHTVFPPPACGFQPRMKLEAIDPKHQSCLCVVSVVEVKGCRLRLHFDGWSESYDFWTNADSPFLFYAGWASKYNQHLNPPRGMMKTDFNWNMYLANNKAYAAPKSLFSKIHPSNNGFEVGMKLEAVDRKNPDLTCVASITNIIGDHLLIHFDNWDDTYDYWCQSDCPYIHPIGWCDSVGLKIIPPQDDQVHTFRWDEYLKLTGSKAVQPELFAERPTSSFVIGQKLEAIDPRNSSLARVGTIAEVEDYRIKIHFDGWDHMYDFWFDSDATDIHPVGWCEHTGHPLEPPPSPFKKQDPALCPTRGCRGIGHVKGAKYTSHHSIFGCPYSCQNLERGSPLVDRLASNSMGEEPSLAVRIQKTSSAQGRSSDDAEDDSPPTPVVRSVGRPMKKNGAAFKSAKLMAAKAIKSKYANGGTNDWNSTEAAIRSKQGDRFATNNDQVVYNGLSSTPKSVVYGNVTSPVQITRYRKYEEQKDSPANTWTVKDVTDYILNISTHDQASRFDEQQIDGEALLLLSQGDMIRHLGIKLGPALKIYNEIRKL